MAIFASLKANCRDWITRQLSEHTLATTQLNVDLNLGDEAGPQCNPSPQFSARATQLSAPRAAVDGSLHAQAGGVAVARPWLLSPEDEVICKLTAELEENHVALKAHSAEGRRASDAPPHHGVTLQRIGITVGISTCKTSTPASGGSLSPMALLRCQPTSCTSSTSCSSASATRVCTSAASSRRSSSTGCDTDLTAEAGDALAAVVAMWQLKLVTTEAAAAAKQYHLESQLQALRAALKGKELAIENLQLELAEARAIAGAASAKAAAVVQAAESTCVAHAQLLAEMDVRLAASTSALHACQAERDSALQHATEANQRADQATAKLAAQHAPEVNLLPQRLEVQAEHTAVQAASSNLHARMRGVATGMESIDNLLRQLEAQSKVQF